MKRFSNPYNTSESCWRVLPNCFRVQLIPFDVGHRHHRREPVEKLFGGTPAGQPGPHPLYGLARCDRRPDPQHRAQCRQYGARATGCSRRSGGGVLGPKGCELRGQARRGIGDYRAVGDAEFQRKCIGKMQNIATGEGRTVFFVSHNLPAIVNLCTSAICLNDGKIVQIGEPNVVCAGYAVLRNTALKSRNSSDILEEIILSNTANQPSPNLM